MNGVIDINVRTGIEKREILVKHYNDALELMERMKTDKGLRLVYRDVDLEKFADRCREALAEEWQGVDNIELPFKDEVCIYR